MEKIVAGIAIVILILNLFFAYQGGKKNRNSKYNRITIIVGLVYGGIVGLGILIGVIFF
ncbi:hypothetical protein [Sinanaerobacter chloroacetimidivorans]|jgi:hypothetical protein|uniref:Uncharacterized protein n=1 Tax=Sinanaerobacter chloroacetimidivorans TaxID=2818044 RepID=A0A8J7W147_9FIRM|nr:hypothetical protein [Sinanaerobacter chloroacetimidivorans]MBR0597256.1 hypothetical protein [Sinanaerobacter chloroacetimidivorans]